MKKIICAILICLMIPTSSLLFTGCKDKKLNIQNFYSTYKSIGNNASNLKLTEVTNTYTEDNNSYKIVIDYSKSTRLSLLVDDSSTQYYHLEHFYQQLLDDSLSPLYFFGEKISTSKKISKNQTKLLFNALSTLEQEYKDIDYRVGSLMNSLEAVSDDVVNLPNLKKVFDEYEQAITAAGNLSSIICDVYFNTVLSNSNYDYSVMNYDQLNETDITRIVLDTRARMYYYKSVYADIYNQLYIRDQNLADQIISNPAISHYDYAPYTFIKNTTSLKAKPMTNLLSYKQPIHNYAVSLYNIQLSFASAYNNFKTATNKVVFSKLDSESSVDDKNYGIIITQFSNGIAYDTYEILKNLTNLIYNI